MKDSRTLLIVSDIHYAGASEKARGPVESDIVANPFLRAGVRAYRHFIWRRDPYAHNHLFERFLDEAPRADYVVGNGDYSCDSAFVGVSDEPAFCSAAECLDKMRQRFGRQLFLVMGDHELGKVSLLGGRGGLRLASWHRAIHGLGLQPFWELEIGRYVLFGITSSLIALPVYEPETLAEELPEWRRLRDEHLEIVRKAFDQIKPEQRLVLFCHDPSALPFLWREDAVRRKLSQIEKTVIGHLHSNLLLAKSRFLAGMPAIHFLGNAIRRMSVALKEARCWDSFQVSLCPALTGIQLLKDGGYYFVELDLDAKRPLRFSFRPLPWQPWPLTPKAATIVALPE